MNIVIQCAATKRGRFFRTLDEREVVFVAEPASAPRDDGRVYAHPDDRTDNGLTWRESLLRYNEASDNPLKLARAFELYENPIYRRLVTRFGVAKVFILSAGWGLINAAFFTPYYDITFSRNVLQKGEAHKLRGKKATSWHDLRQLRSSDEPVVFFGGKDYVPLFCALTRSYLGKRIVFYNSEAPLAAPGCLLQRFPTTTRTNWHYECANAFLNGQMTVDEAELTPRVEEGIPTPGVRTKQAWSDCGAVRAAPRRSARAPRAEDFRKGVRALLDQAEQKGLAYLDINAGELHRQVGGYPGANHRMPQCCDAMRGLMTSSDVVLSEPPSGRGAALEIRYALPRAG